MKYFAMLLLSAVCFAQSVPSPVNRGVGMFPNGPCTPVPGYVGVCPHQHVVNGSLVTDFDWFGVDGILHPFVATMVSTPGPKGDKGDPGPQGPQGAQGPVGPVGPVGTIPKMANYLFTCPKGLNATLCGKVVTLTLQ